VVNHKSKKHSKAQYSQKKEKEQKTAKRKHGLKSFIVEEPSNSKPARKYERGPYKIKEKNRKYLKTQIFHLCFVR
jgi:hypothetical protein